jgi:hypothetical protein
MKKILAICCRPENYNDFFAIGKRIIKKAREIFVVIVPVNYHPSKLNPTLRNFPLLNIFSKSSKCIASTRKNIACQSY